MFNEQSENRKKHIGFRLPVPDYIRVVQKADGMGVSITDYLHSLIYPSINQNGATVQHEPYVKPVNETSFDTEYDKEALFNKGCKADEVLNIFNKEKKASITTDELKKTDFPMDLLLNDESGIQTTNFILEKVNDMDEYKLTRL